MSAWGGDHNVLMVWPPAGVNSRVGKEDEVGSATQAGVLPSSSGAGFLRVVRKRPLSHAFFRILLAKTVEYRNAQKRAIKRRAGFACQSHTDVSEPPHRYRHRELKPRWVLTPRLNNLSGLDRRPPRSLRNGSLVNGLGTLNRSAHPSSPSLHGRLLSWPNGNGSLDTAHLDEIVAGEEFSCIAGAFVA